ncbi:MAG: hypothetical protein R3Y64_09845 [Peptostreptococcaceae bacterium]
MKIKQNNVEMIQMVLSCYVKGLCVQKDSVFLPEEVQRIVENALIEYSKEEIESQSFLFWTMQIVNSNILIGLSANEYEVRVEMPANKVGECFELTGNVTVQIVK